MKFFTSLLFSTILATTALAVHAPMPRAEANKRPPAPTLSPLTTWAEDSLRAIITATNSRGLSAAFDAFLAPDVDITINGSPLSRADYISKRVGKGFDPTSSINFTASIEVPAVANSSAAGVVALFLRDHVSDTVVSAANLVIKPDASISTAHGADNRRVSIINQVILGA
ncbi:hypothetical protein C8R46DRAFT_1231809 [Mycena filopes]|nr:hypothetical protein C8R46DRAFT_1231809 [Mycena filopes]